MSKVKSMEAKLELLCANIKTLIDGGNASPTDGIIFSDLVQSLQDQLRVFDEEWVNGAIKEDDGTISPGQGEFVCNF